MSNTLSPSVSALLAHLKSKGKDRSWNELTKKFNPKANSDSWARSIARSNGWVDGDMNDWSVDGHIEKRKNNAQINNLQERIKQLTSRLEKTNDALDKSLAIKETTRYEKTKITFNNSIINEGVAIAQFSDWHVGKKIEKRTMNGLNEYNPDIAEKRSKTCTSNLLKLIKKERQDIKIENIVINLGGDAIQNFLHESDYVQNYLTPIEEVRLAKRLIGNSLKTIAEVGNFKKIVLLCTRGNHPRLTKKMQSDMDYKMNLEAMLYWIMADEFNDPIFEWHIQQSDIGYYDLGNYRLRYFHGHQINFQGGVGGLTIPLNKKIMYWDKTNKSDWNLVSHWHNMSLEGNASINGCLCGYDAYAQTLGFKYVPPTQAFQLLDKKRGFTGRFPIFCE